MNYSLIKDLIDLARDFEYENRDESYKSDVEGFKYWLANKERTPLAEEPSWEGKENGRSAESAISTMLVHLNRYAKTYSRAAIHDSLFSTQEDFIYLINLKAFGPMTKAELIKRNIHDKPSGMQIINRLAENGWVSQSGSVTDKRSKIISITEKGEAALQEQMDNIRLATKIVTGDLSRNEKMELIRLLDKLCVFHQHIFSQRIHTADLLQRVQETYPGFNN